MATQLDRARREIERAAADAEGTVREQLQSIDEGLEEIAGGDETRDAHPHDDRLAELEQKLDGLADETDGEVRAAIDAARRWIHDFRRRDATER